MSHAEPLADMRRLDSRLRHPGHLGDEHRKPEGDMRAIVTGGAGFIGSHLIEALVVRGDDVVCIERPGWWRGWIEGLPIEVSEVGIDDAWQLRRIFDGADVVFHLAGLTQARSPADYYAVNTEGTARVLEAAAVHNGSAPRLVFVSSLAAIGPCRNGDALSPDSVPYPLSHYGHSKLLAEAAVHAYADRVPTTILRLAAVYGPRERGILKLFQLVGRGIALTVGPWDRQLSLLYVRDAVQGLISAATRDGRAGRTYCLAHPEPVTWAEFAYAVGRALGREPFLVSVPTSVARGVAVAAEIGARFRRAAATLNRERVREMAQARWVCDPSRALAEFGFRPEYPVERGVPETAAWYREVQWL